MDRNSRRFSTFGAAGEKKFLLNPFKLLKNGNRKRCGQNLNKSSSVARPLINSLYNSNLISHLDAAQMSKEFLLSLTLCTSHIKANVNHVVATRHVSSPIDSKLVDD